MDNLFLSLARAILDGVLGEITKQLNVVDTQVMSVLQGFVKDVVGGMWQGPDADAFVSDLNGLLPKVQDVHQRTGAFSTGIFNAAAHIFATDQAASNQVADLVNIFSKIY